MANIKVDGEALKESLDKSKHNLMLADALAKKTSVTDNTETNKDDFLYVVDIVNRVQEIWEHLLQSWGLERGWDVVEVFGILKETFNDETIGFSHHQEFEKEIKDSDTDSREFHYAYNCGFLCCCHCYDAIIEIKNGNVLFAYRNIMTHAGRQLGRLIALRDADFFREDIEKHNIKAFSKERAKNAARKKHKANNELKKEILERFKNGDLKGLSKNAAAKKAAEEYKIPYPTVRQNWLQPLGQSEK